MSETIDSFLDTCDIEIESRATLKNPEGYISQIENSIFNMIINVVVDKLCEAAINCGWDSHDRPLGDFIEHDGKRLGLTDFHFSNGVVGMLNEYGRLFLEHLSTPFILLKEKDTGNVVDLTGMELVSLMSNPVMAEFVDSLDV